MPYRRAPPYISKQNRAEDVRQASNPHAHHRSNGASEAIARSLSSTASQVSGICLKEIDVGILGTLLGKREPVVTYRTVDGGHPAPFPDMTDEQLYNYEVTFNVPNRTFKEPPRSVRPPENRPVRKESPLRKEPHTETVAQKTQERPRDTFSDTQRHTATARRPTQSTQSTQTTQAPPVEQKSLPPLDLGKPVRLVTTKQPVEIITTRARHPVYKVHAYIGDDDVVTVFTLEGQLSENGPRYLENVPQRRQLFLNIYPSPDVRGPEKYQLTQHDTKEQADAAARPGRIACVPVQFDV